MLSVNYRNRNICAINKKCFYIMNLQFFYNEYLILTIYTFREKEIEVQ